MRGQHHIKISNQRVHFSFSVQRNITIIRGDSATGKTTLVGMLSDYETLGKQSGVTITMPCTDEHLAPFYLQNQNIQRILNEIES